MASPSLPGPLAGIKVLELGQLIAGPFAGKMFAEFGAEVIKIEPPPEGKNPGGDPLRQWRLLHHGTSLWWYVQARNKKSVTANLRTPEGQEIVRRLARDADIVIENFRPGTLEKWGLGYDALSFEWTDESGKKQKAEKVGIAFAKNVYSWWTLQPGESCFTSDS